MNFFICLMTGFGGTLLTGRFSPSATVLSSWPKVLFGSMICCSIDFDTIGIWVGLNIMENTFVPNLYRVLVHDWCTCRQSADCLQ